MGKIPFQPVIDFTEYIAEHTQSFTGRGWIFKAIDTWLADTQGARFFLLTGVPSSGKTALAARLAQFSQGAETAPDGLSQLEPDFLSALYFCSARSLFWSNPNEFLRSLSLQLAECYQVFAGALIEESGDHQISIGVVQYEMIHITQSINISDQENL